MQCPWEKQEILIQTGLWLGNVKEGDHFKAWERIILKLSWS
jgi:hypothetical protein